MGLPTNSAMAPWEVLHFFHRLHSKKRLLGSCASISGFWVQPTTKALPSHDLKNSYSSYGKWLIYGWFSYICRLKVLTFFSVIASELGSSSVNALETHRAAVQERFWGKQSFETTENVPCLRRSLAVRKAHCLPHVQSCSTLWLWTLCTQTNTQIRSFTTWMWCSFGFCHEYNTFIC